MKLLPSLLTVSLAAILMEQASAQNAGPGASSISIQPILWLDSLVPNDLTGFSAQYETALSRSQSVAARAVWFRDPLFPSTSSRSNGYALSLEYRQYMSNSATGWHVGPFAEWIVYEHLGGLRALYGSKFRSVIDFGAVAGHKWVNNRFIFDVSLRTSWYSPATYPRSGYFPRMPGSNYNSFMILTAGYAID